MVFKKTGNDWQVVLIHGAVDTSVPELSRRFEDFGIDFVKKIGVEFLDRRIGVFFIDDETEVDVRGAVRNHQDIDIGNAAEGAAGDSFCVLETAYDLET